MPDPITTTKAIMDYMSAPLKDGSPSKKPTMQEMKEFKQSCTTDQWKKYGEQAAAELGTTILKEA